MSVLIVGGEEIVRATIDRLVTQGDEVRVVENDPRTGEEWRSLGVHVARGPILDADLIERSAQNCRTLVLVDGGIGTESVSEIFDGAALAGVERVVVCTRQRDGIGEALRALPGQYVLLLAGGRRGLLGKRDWVASPEDLARAIDAADDLGGEVRLEVDLSEQEAWRVLGLDPP